MTHSGFVVPIFEGGDLCDIDGKTYAFHFRLVLPSETSKRVTNTYFTTIIRSFNLTFRLFTLIFRLFTLKLRLITYKSGLLLQFFGLFIAKLRPLTLKFWLYTLYFRLLIRQVRPNLLGKNKVFFFLRNQASISRKKA